MASGARWFFFLWYEGAGSMPFLKGFGLCGLDDGHLSPCVFFWGPVCASVPALLAGRSLCHPLKCGVAGAGALCGPHTWLRAPRESPCCCAGSASFSVQVWLPVCPVAWAKGLSFMVQLKTCLHSSSTKANWRGNTHAGVLKLQAKFKCDTSLFQGSWDRWVKTPGSFAALKGRVVFRTITLWPSQDLVLWQKGYHTGIHPTKY